MNSVQFGNYDSYDDFSLFLASKEIGTAEPKKKIVEVEGSDGVLDFTEYFGDVKYNNRTLKMDFSLIHSDLLGQYSSIQDAIHGKKMNISFSEDSGFYYVGRITVEPFTKEKNIGRFSITADCDPYKYKTNETIVTQSVSGSKTITLTNSRKRVVPTITTNAEMSFTFGATTVTHTAGTFIIPELELVEGNNTIKVAGTGNVSFKYREGRL